MKIGIVGLGLIGGSYAKALKKLNHTLIGYDINAESVEYALKNHIVDYAYTDMKEDLSLCDVVFVCLYPELTVKYIKEQQNVFKQGAIISDVSGIKVEVMNQLLDITENHFEIVFAHPIAGRETSGIQYALDGLFNQMNFILTPHHKNTQRSIEVITSLASDMGFKNITQMTPEEHDHIIGYTSQLTHVIALALVNASDYNEQTKIAIGDSYKDLTRIARMNETLWTELFLKNKENLVHIIEHFEKSINEIKIAVKNEDEDTLKKLMIKSTKRREHLDE